MLGSGWGGIRANGKVEIRFVSFPVYGIWTGILSLLYYPYYVMEEYSYHIYIFFLIRKYRFSLESLHRSVMLFGSMGLVISQFTVCLGSQLCNGYTKV